MKMIPDKTGRFPQRPHYDTEELEEECERIIESLLMRRYGQYAIPVPTEALVELLERETEQLNLYADLSAEGEEVHGVTEFRPGRKPTVMIARELTYQRWREHRKRSTLPHEYGHVHWHAWLFDRYRNQNERHKCLRATIITAAGNVDWMEWLANYVAGALLMPRSRLLLLARSFRAERGVEARLNEESVEGRLLIERVSELFNASAEAAAMRLRQVGQLF